MAFNEHLIALQEVVQDHDIIPFDMILAPALVVLAVTGVVRSWRSLNRQEFDDSVFIEPRREKDL